VIITVRHFPRYNINVPGTSLKGMKYTDGTPYDLRLVSDMMLAIYGGEFHYTFNKHATGGMVGMAIFSKKELWV